MEPLLTVEELRPDSADPDQVARILELEEAAFGGGGLWNRWLLVPFIRYGQVLAGRLGEEIVGVGELMRDWREPDLAYFYGLVIGEEWRGRGLGSRLMGLILHKVAADGFGRVQLTVDPANQGAIHIYREKMGFGVVAELKEAFGAGEDRLLMELFFDGQA